MTVSVGMDDYERFRAWAKQADRKIAAGQRKRIRQIGAEMAREVMAEGAEGMPAGGGLRERLVGGKAAVQMLAAGVRIRLGAKGAGVGRIDSTGTVRHPTYGNRKAWASTEVEPGTWTKAFEERADEVRTAVREELDSILREAKSL